VNRITIAAFSAVLAIATPARATNYQDLWWNPNESGWGIQIVQQADVMFATWFVYAQNGQPLWFTTVARPQSAGSNIWIGPEVYGVTGTFFGTVTFAPIVVRVAGNARFTFTDAKSGTLTYTYDNTTVNKPITRQNLVPINISGTYQGGIFRSGTGCSNTNNNGTRLGDPTTFSVVHTAGTDALTINELGGTLCRFSGTLTQFGSSYEASGSYTCQGETGTWTGREGTQTETTFGLKMALRPVGDVCTVNATIGGFKQPAG
jgi:hypothetical protein